MPKVSVIGIGIARFGVRPEGLAALVAEAGRAALADAGVSPGGIEAFYLGNYAGDVFVHQNHLAPWCAGALGLEGLPCTRVEGACASSGLAFIQGVQAIVSGAHDLVMVAGGEKMTETPVAETTEVLSAAAEWEEVLAGATFPALFALVARRHMHQYGTPREAMAEVAVKNHGNALHNPNAHFRKPITREDVLNARPVADPLGLFDCSPVSDGAAALILCSADRAADFKSAPVDVLGYGQASDHMTLHAKADVTRFPATERAGRRAFAMAGLTPDDIDVIEVHDCFTIAEITAIEDLGFVEKGGGGPATLEGYTALGGPKPVNSSGGLKAKGHPVGATGAAQIAEIVTQLRGLAGERQAADAEVGLAHNLGGSGATCAVTILGKRA